MYQLFFSDYPDITVLAPLCREYQVDWLTNQIKDFIYGDASSNQDKDCILKYLSVSEEMDFGSINDVKLINSLHDNFHSLQTSTDFPLLSRQKQILIARKRLWLLLRHLDEEDRNLILNEEQRGFLSVFEDQTVFKFKYNSSEEDYIRKYQDLQDKLEVDESD